MIFTNWSLSCALLFGIIGSHLFLWVWNCDKTLTSFKNTLTEEQKTSFKTVYRIRLGISITSFILRVCLLRTFIIGHQNLLLLSLPLPPLSPLPMFPFLV